MHFVRVIQIANHLRSYNGYNKKEGRFWVQPFNQTREQSGGFKQVYKSIRMFPNTFFT